MQRQLKVAVSLTFSKDTIGKCILMVQSLLNNSVKPSLVFINLSTWDFKGRMNGLPDEVGNFILSNPIVKVMWDGQKNPLVDNNEYFFIEVHDSDKIGVDFIQDALDKFASTEPLDMTMVSIFYDVGVNPFRKDATRKAVQHWLMQKKLPREMIFMELGFNGVFTFSEEDFPEQIKYVRVDGTDNNKYLFQKEHLWNIAAKKATYEKLMFVDSDIAPLEDVDWFKQVYDALDECLFTQGFRKLTYLNEDDSPSDIMKFSFSHEIVNETVFQNQSVPGGVYCITKTVLYLIGFFNYLPLGGGDNLFWHEIASISNHRIWFTLCARSDLKETFSLLADMTSKSKFGEVSVDVVHFYHGDKKKRTYTQRHYLMLTQFPWMDKVICEDQNGLLAWVDTNHYFYEAMSKLHTVSDDKYIASKLVGDHFDYIKFVNGLAKRKYKSLSRFELTKIIRELIRECRIGGNSDED